MVQLFAGPPLSLLRRKEVVRLENVLVKGIGSALFDRHNRPCFRTYGILLQHFCGRAALVGSSCSRVVYFKVTLVR
jgi:hypothetical protein